MTNKKIVTVIIGAMVTAGLTASAGFFPQLNSVFTAIVGLVTAVVAYINGEDNSQ